jgi:hypothetical protein
MMLKRSLVQRSQQDGDRKARCMHRTAEQYGRMSKGVQQAYREQGNGHEKGALSGRRPLKVFSISDLYEFLMWQGKDTTARVTGQRIWSGME